MATLKYFSEKEQEDFVIAAFALLAPQKVALEQLGYDSYSLMEPYVYGYALGFISTRGKIMIHESGRGFTKEQFQAATAKIMELFFDDEWKNIFGTIRDYLGSRAEYNAGKSLDDFNTGRLDGRIESYLAHNGYPSPGLLSHFGEMERNEYEQLRAELMEREGVTIPDYLGLEES